MPSQEDINVQQQLLVAHRRTLVLYLQQQAKLGTSYTPPGIMTGIREARDQIRRIKNILHGWGVVVEDLPDDEEPILGSESAKSHSSLKKPDDLHTQLQEAGTGKELLDLLQKIGVVDTPMVCPFPPDKDTTIACLKNTVLAPAGTRAKVLEFYDPSDKKWWPQAYRNTDRYKVKWSNGKEEVIDKRRHEIYGFVYAYDT